jgi:hypothetical protein
MAVDEMKMRRTGRVATLWSVTRLRSGGGPPGAWEVAAFRTHLAHVASGVEGTARHTSPVSGAACGAPLRDAHRHAALRLAGRPRSQIAQQSLKRLLVAVVVFPSREIADVPGTVARFRRPTAMF